MRWRCIALLGLALPLVGCAQDAPTPGQRKVQIEAIEERVTEGALQRKQGSEDRLRREGVPVNPHLPVIEDVARIDLRSRDEVAWRAIALLIVAVKGEGIEQGTIEELVARHAVADRFTPDEAAFIADPDPSQHDRVQFAWRYEAAWTLLWALGYIETLDAPTTICDVPRAVGIVRDLGSEQFVAGSRLRSIEAILDQADLIYRYHWAVVDARPKGSEPPAGLDPSVTQERHHALNWLIGYMGQDWDDVSTDT